MEYKNIDVYVKCPFYIHNSEKTVTCEGIVSDTAKNLFKSEEEKNNHMFKACCDSYHECGYYKAVSKNYEVKK